MKSEPHSRYSATIVDVGAGVLLLARGCIVVMKGNASTKGMLTGLEKTSKTIVTLVAAQTREL